jgi:hypothetical protein
MRKRMNRLSLQTRTCVEALLQTHAVGLATAMTRQLEGEYHNKAQHIRLMMDCVAASSFAATLLSQKSQFHSPACALCAAMLETCAKDCEQLGELDDRVDACSTAAAQCTALARPEHAEVLEMASRLPPDA